MPISLFRVHSENNQASFTLLDGQPSEGFQTTQQAKSWARDNVAITDKKTLLTTVRVPLQAFEVTRVVSLNAIELENPIFKDHKDNGTPVDPDEEDHSEKDDDSGDEVDDDETTEENIDTDNETTEETSEENDDDNIWGDDSDNDDVTL